MESDKYGQHRNTPSRIGGAGMSTLDHARAYEGMKQAMALGNLTLETMRRVRSLLRSLGHAVGRPDGSVNRQEIRSVPR